MLAAASSAWLPCRAMIASRRRWGLSVGAPADSGSSVLLVCPALHSPGSRPAGCSASSPASPSARAGGRAAGRWAGRAGPGRARAGGIRRHAPARRAPPGRPLRPPARRARGDADRAALRPARRAAHLAPAPGADRGGGPRSPARPDRVTGDQVDDYARDVEPFAAAFSGLSAPLGVFAIPGNHDVYAGWEEVRRGLEAMGITVLVNRAVPLERNGARFWLAGTGDPARPARQHRSRRTSSGRWRRFRRTPSRSCWRTTPRSGRRWRSAAWS